MTWREKCDIVRNEAERLQKEIDSIGWGGARSYFEIPPTAVKEKLDLLCYCSVVLFWADHVVSGKNPKFTKEDEDRMQRLWRDRLALM